MEKLYDGLGKSRGEQGQFSPSPNTLSELSLTSLPLHRSPLTSSTLKRVSGEGVYYTDMAFIPLSTRLIIMSGI